MNRPSLLVSCTWYNCIVTIKNIPSLSKNSFTLKNTTNIFEIYYRFFLFILHKYGIINKRQKLYLFQYFSGQLFTISHCKCKMDPDESCYFYGELTIIKNRGTMTGHINKIYFAYCGCKIRDQDKPWE